MIVLFKHFVFNYCKNKNLTCLSSGVVPKKNTKG